MCVGLPKSTAQILSISALVHTQGEQTEQLWGSSHQFLYKNLHGCGQVHPNEIVGDSVSMAALYRLSLVVGSQSSSLHLSLAG